MTARDVAKGVGAAGAGIVAACALAAPLVGQWEGLRNDPYNDIANVRTVCFGETYNVQERRYSDAECYALLNSSLAKHATGALRCIPADTPIQTQAAFVSLAYNIGVQAACGSTVARRLTARDVYGACKAFILWNRARSPVTGKLTVSRGLTNRRIDETTLCMKGVPV